MKNKKVRLWGTNPQGQTFFLTCQNGHPFSVSVPPEREGITFEISCWHCSALTYLEMIPADQLELVKKGTLQ